MSNERASICELSILLFLAEGMQSHLAFLCREEGSMRIYACNRARLLVGNMELPLLLLILQAPGTTISATHPNSRIRRRSMRVRKRLRVESTRYSSRTERTGTPTGVVGTITECTGRKELRIEILS